MPSLRTFLLTLPIISACGAEAPPAVSPMPAESTRTEQQRSVLEPKQVVFALGGSENDYRKCFMRSIGSRGYVRTRFDLSESGEVERVAISESTLDRPDVADCISTRLKNQLFGSLDGPKSAEWTFVFRLADPLSDSKFRGRLQAERRKREDGIVLTKASRGTLDLDRVAERVAVNYPLVARCYRASIERQKAPGGVLRLKLQIGEDGKVRSVSDAGSVMADAFAVDCAAEGFFAMEFPSPVGGVAELLYRLELE